MALLPAYLLAPPAREWLPGCAHHWEPLRATDGSLVLRCTRAGCGHTVNWSAVRETFKRPKR